MNSIDIRNAFKQRVFEYSTYNGFLKSYFNYRRQMDRSFSLQSWASTARVSSGSYLRKIIKADRHPGKNVVDALCIYFNFEEDQKEYFEGLVTLAKAKNNPQLRTLVTTRLRELNPKKKFHDINEEVFSLISEWQHPVLHELAQLKDFQEDPEWIAKKLRFPISPEKIEESLNRLIKLGLLKRRPRTQRLVPSNPNVEFQTATVSKAARLNYVQNLENAKTALEEIPVEEREFSGSCFNIEKEDYKKIVDEVADFKKKLIEKYERSEGDETLQLQFQGFLYTKSEEPHV